MQEFVIEDGVLVRYNGTETKVVIPEGVTAIGEYCFQGNKTLRSVHLPESFKEVQAHAFEGCTLDYIYGIGCCAFTPHSLENCRVMHVYVGHPYFYLTCGYKHGTIHSEKSESTWDYCWGHRPGHCGPGPGIVWKGDYAVFHAKQVRAEAKERLPVLRQQLKDYKKAHRGTACVNRVALEGTPVWLGILIFLLVTAAAYWFCRDMAPLQKYFLKYIVPVAAGILALVVVKIIRLIWKAIRFHNKASKACTVRDAMAALNEQIDTWVGLERRYSDLKILELQNKVIELEVEFDIHYNGIPDHIRYAVAMEQAVKNGSQTATDNGADWNGMPWGIG